MNNHNFLQSLYLSFLTFFLILFTVNSIIYNYNNNENISHNKENINNDKIKNNNINKQEKQGTGNGERGTVSFEKQELYKIKSVYDGDTMRVIYKGEELRIRYLCIDAPELAQPLGKESRDYLLSLFANHDNQVMLDIIKQDRYGRNLAVVYLPSGEIVQELQVRNGWAYSYPEYSSDCPVWDDIEKAEAIAKNNRVNIYSGNYQRPSDYRKKKGTGNREQGTVLMDNGQRR